MKSFEDLIKLLKIERLKNEELKEKINEFIGCLKFMKGENLATDVDLPFVLLIFSRYQFLITQENEYNDIFGIVLDFINNEKLDFINNENNDYYSSYLLNALQFCCVLKDIKKVLNESRLVELSIILGFNKAAKIFQKYFFEYKINIEKTKQQKNESTYIENIEYENDLVNLFAKTSVANVEKFLHKYPDYSVARSKENGWSPLFLACKGGNLEVVKFLIYKGVNLDYDSGQCLPFFMAFYLGHEAIAEFLLNTKIMQSHCLPDPRFFKHFIYILNLSSTPGEIKPLFYKTFSKNIVNILLQNEIMQKDYLLDNDFRTKFRYIERGFSQEIKSLFYDAFYEAEVKYSKMLLH